MRAIESRDKSQRDDRQHETGRTRQQRLQIACEQTVEEVGAGEMPGRRHQHVNPTSGGRSDPELEIE